MKQLKHFLFLIISFSFLTILNVHGQDTNMPNLPCDSKTGKIIYTEVVFLDSTITKQEIFSAAREWFAKTFTSATDVIKMEDKEQGIIIGKCAIPISTPEHAFREGNYYTSTISLYFKDGRYKFEITDLVYLLTVTGFRMPTDILCHPDLAYEKYGKKAVIHDAILLNDVISYLINDLAISISDKTKSLKQDNW